MKFLIYADSHWSSYSSIVRSRGNKYSTRLENLIQTMDWLESLALEEMCDEIVCLGDFFDKSDLTSEEITALGEVHWKTIPHTFLVGNHEMGRSTLEFSSSHLFELIPKCKVIDKPYLLNWRDITFVFLPYILEEDRKSLIEYYDEHMKDNVVVFSHNDISGIQMGKFISKDGFSLEEIENNCRVFFNGHLHNGEQIGKNIINVGNITGQNFSENALYYKHQAIIFDTDDFSVQWIENPHAMKFYRLDLTFHKCNTEDDERCKALFESLGNNAVVAISATTENSSYIKNLMSSHNNIIDGRVVIDISSSTPIIEDVEMNKSLSIDHISKFSEYISTILGNEELVMEELSKIRG